MAPDRRDVGLAALAIALPLLALVASLPRHPLILGVLNDFAHTPVFGAFAVIVRLLIGRRSRVTQCAQYGIALSAAIAAGGAVELIQPFLGRGAAWQDLCADALGAIAGLALHHVLTTPGAWRRMLGIALALAAALPVSWPVLEAARGYAARLDAFPVILRHRVPADGYFIRAHAVELEPTELPARWRRPGDALSLRIRMTGSDWPGIAHVEPAPDWRGYSRLVLDMTNPEPYPISLTLRVHDRQHDNRADDRFNRSFELSPLRRSMLTIPLQDIELGPRGRELNLAQIAGLILFAGGGAGDLGREYFVTSIWLE